MADSILIEGSLTPAVGYLKRGEQAEVALTDTVRDLITKGYLIEVKAGSAASEPKEPVAPSTIPGQGTPVQAPDQSVPEVSNPAVDNSLVDATVPTTTRTSTAKK